MAVLSTGRWTPFVGAVGIIGTSLMAGTPETIFIDRDESTPLLAATLGFPPPLADTSVEASTARRTRASVSEVGGQVGRDRELQTLRQSKAIDRVELDRLRAQRNAAVLICMLALAALALIWSRARMRERSYRELERAANTDPLTGLLNRRGLCSQVGGSVVAKAGNSLIICDVDNFKWINDVHGHDVGDAVLTETARRMRAQLRPEDAAARWGGDEFLVLLGGGCSDSASRVAERLRKTVAEIAQTGIPGGLSVTISIGVAASVNGQDFDLCMRAADQALMRAKREGKNRVVVAHKDHSPPPNATRGQYRQNQHADTHVSNSER